MINRNNYEEYFLLLADKELSPEEEMMIQQFAAKHPDLQEELDIILSCRLDADDIAPSFPKEKLLRSTAWDAENPAPIHTQMLLLLDNELAPAEQQQLQATIAASTALQTEWHTLQQTKLVAEAIAHPDKESLYRKERQVRPLVWMRWVAAAAVVLGFGWFAWTYNNSESAAPESSVLAENKPAQPGSAGSNTPTNTPSISTTAQATEEVAGETAAQDVATALPKTAVAAVKTNTTPTTQSATNEIHLPKEGAANDLADKKPEDILLAQISPSENDPVLANLNSTDVTLSPLASENTVMHVDHISAKTIAALPAPVSKQKNDVFTGSKTMLTDDEEEYVTIGGARIQKQKMRGLFRNVTRSVTRSFSKSRVEPDVYATK